MKNTDENNLENGNNGILKQGANDVGNKIAKNMSDKALNETAKKATVKGKIAAAAGPVIFWGSICIIVIICIIGIIMFLITMPGMALGKIKELFNIAGNYVGAFFGVDTSRQIQPAEIFDTLNYLEDMGYDLKNFGFLTDYYTNDDKSEIEESLTQEEKEEGYTIDEKVGVVRNSSNNKIILAKSDFIFTYIMSDNYIYTVKNTNLVTQPSQAKSGFWGFIDRVMSGIEALELKINNFFFYKINNYLGITKDINDTWGRGLLDIYYEKSLGVEGDPYVDGFANFDTVAVDTATKELVLAKNGWFKKNAAMRYKIDGWVGKYGMPVEFLLSIHVATMMPDLSYDLATSFDTNVKIYLRTVSGKRQTFYLNDDGEYVSYDEMVQATEDLIYNDNDSFSRLGIFPSNHPKECGCIVIDSSKYGKPIEMGNGSTVKYIRAYGFFGEEYPLYVSPNDDNERFLVTDIDDTDDYMILLRYKDKNGEEKSMKVSEEAIIAKRLDQDVYDVISGKVGDYIIKYDQKCIDYFNTIRQAMDNSQDSKYETYIPYIASVKNHWYRDIYYVLELDKKQNIIVNDYDYESLYKDRWSLFETYTKDEIETPYSEYAKENVGNFKLYVLNDEGEYATPDNIGSLANNKKVFKDKKYSDLYIYAGTNDEAKDDKIHVSKKSVVLNDNSGNISNENFEDLNWNMINSNIWSAYKDSNNDSKSNPELAYSLKEIEENPDLGRIYVKTSFTTDQILQTGEGQRGETNPEIKKMFLENTYFRYDTNDSTAEIITALREKISRDKLGNTAEDETRGDKYGPLNGLAKKVGKSLVETDVTDATYSEKELGLGDGNKQYAVKDYSGQVVLTQDSLNAFNMLENIHTEDADYIYKDFKELIVELGYFTKEELTDEMPRLLQWIVPDAGSNNFPRRSIDKRENEYGTMIHSYGDLNAVKYLEAEISGTKEKRISNNKPTLDPMSLYQKAYNYKYGTILTSDVTVTQFLDKTQEFWNEMSRLNYDYCSVNEGGCSGHDGRLCGLADTFQRSKIYTHIVQYDNGTENGAVHNVSNPTFLSWILIDLNTHFENFCNESAKPPRNIVNSADVARTCVEELCGKIITEYNELQPGDIVAYVDKGESDVTAVKILGDNNNNQFTIYDVSEGVMYGQEPRKDFGEREFYDTSKYEVVFGIRVFGVDNYIGYKGNEAVVSPVTGILLEYGTYTRDDKDSLTGEEYRVNVDMKYGPVLAGYDSNNDATKQYSDEIVSDKVGYAKILVLDQENYLYLEKATNNRWKNNSLVDDFGMFKEELVDDKDSLAMEKLRGTESDDSMRWSKMDQTIYGYKEFAEEYEKMGIAGYIVYIDGFVCEEPDIGTHDTLVEIPYANDSERKNKAKLSIDEVTSSLVGKSFKQVTPENFEDYKMALKSEYIEDKEMQMQSDKATHKQNAEVMVKAKALSSIYLNENISNKTTVDEYGNNIKESLIFIKEGTVLGRTISDKELLEDKDFRAGKYDNYEKNREYTTWKNLDAFDKVIGNYLRIIMRDKDATPVENVENYMKLGVKKEFDWLELYYWSPFESGAIDDRYCGPDNISSCSPGEVAVGLYQETDTVYPYHNYAKGSAISKFFRNCIKRDPLFCSPLNGYTNKDGVDYWEMVDPGFGHIHNGAYYNNGLGETKYGAPSIAPVVKTYVIINGEMVVQGSSQDDGSAIYFVKEHSDGKYSTGEFKRENGETIIDENGNPEIEDEYECFAEGGQVQFFRGCPQRKMILDRYLGDTKAKVESEYRKTELQKTLTKIADDNKDKFTRIQMEVGKEQYLDEILYGDPDNPSAPPHLWLIDRAPCVQGAIFHLLVAGTMSYNKWLPDMETASDEEILLHVRKDWSGYSTTIMTEEEKEKLKADGGEHGRAFVETEIAIARTDGRLTKWDIEDWVRHGGYSPYGKYLLESNGVDYSKINGLGFGY